MSRTAPWLLLILIGVPAGAQPSTAEQAVAAQRSGLRQALRIECPPAQDEEEIVVCGSRAEEDARHRLPLPTISTPGPADRAGGEQRAALAADTSPCTTVGPNQRCTRGLDMIGIGFAVARAVTQALTGRD